MSFVLGRNWRRAILVLHVLCGVGWMGIDLALGLLVFTGRLSDSGPTVAAAYTAARLVIPVVVPVLGTGMLLTGIVLGLGTRYGLVQWTWVLTKLTIGVVLTALIYVALVPAALTIPDELVGSAEQVRDTVGSTGTDLMYPPVVSFLCLGFALVLSIFKPWGRTRWGRRTLETQAEELSRTAR